MIIFWLFGTFVCLGVGILIFGSWEKTKEILSDIGYFFIGLFLYPLLIFMRIFGRNIEIKLGNKIYSVDIKTK